MILLEKKSNAFSIELYNKNDNTCTVLYCSYLEIVIPEIRPLVYRVANVISQVFLQRRNFPKWAEISFLELATLSLSV